MRDLTPYNLRIVVDDEHKLGDFWGLIPKSIVKRIYMGTLDNNMRLLRQLLER